MVSSLSETTDSMSLSDILLDLCGRFLLDVPKEEQDLSRIVFQIEQAWWFYLDFYREAQPTLPNMALRKFASMMFRYTPYLANKVDQSDTAVDEFLKYKHSVPVCGAIILDDTLTKCLLVKGWKSRSTWGFPKGKIDFQEDKYDCAVREVFEETSFDISPWATRTEYIDITVSEQNIRLYMCAGAPLDAEFHPRTRKEISEIRWHLVEELPTQPKQKRGYYMVYPFVRYIRNFIAARQQGKGQKSTGSPTVITKKGAKSKPATAANASAPQPKIAILRKTLLPNPVASDSLSPMPSSPVQRPAGRGPSPLIRRHDATLSVDLFANCRAFEDFAFDTEAIVHTLSMAN